MGVIGPVMVLALEGYDHLHHLCLCRCLLTTVGLLPENCQSWLRSWRPCLRQRETESLSLVDPALKGLTDDIGGQDKGRVHLNMPPPYLDAVVGNLPQWLQCSRG